MTVEVVLTGCKPLGKSIQLLEPHRLCLQNGNNHLTQSTHNRDSRPSNFWYKMFSIKLQDVGFDKIFICEVIWKVEELNRIEKSLYQIFEERVNMNNYYSVQSTKNIRIFFYLLKHLFTKQISVYTYMISEAK